MYIPAYTVIMSKPIVLTASDWNTSSNKYMAPKANKSGGKAISLISKQSNRSLHISTPLMMTWGVADFVDEKGESDGKYSISLNFPMNKEYETPATNQFLQKLKDFENQILEDAVANSELWWGETMSKELCKHTFFPFLKYSKNKDTKKIDTSKPPSIRAKVPYYDGKWSVEIYDTKSNMIFPSESNDSLSPVDLIPKMSSVACVLQCGGIWIGGKGWGLTWKLVQCVVKPRVSVSISGTCQISLTDEDRDALETQEIVEDDDEDVMPSAQVSTEVDNSDDEDEDENTPPPVPEPAKVAPVKKVVKKAVTETVVEVAVETSEDAAVEVSVPKKKIVKKKA